MKPFGPSLFRTLFAAALLVLPVVAFGQQPSAGSKIRLLIVTGGHDFERPQFFKTFEDNPDITFNAVEHPNAQAFFGANHAKEYDAILLYDMHQPISEQAKADFLARLKEGKGLVVLHHAIADYQAWPEFQKIVGARYYLQPTMVAGVQKKASEWKHGVDIPLKIADLNHPITKGVKDFTIHDETYKGFDIFEGVHPLLTTTEPLSSPVVAWVKTYGPARVVYLQSGHDHFAYENSNFRQLLRQAIRWCCRR